MKYAAAHLFACLLLVSCATTTTRQPPVEGFERAVAIVDTAIAEGMLPGAVLWIETPGHSSVRTMGLRAVEPEREENRVDTIYDVASLTKVMATAPSVMILAERGRIDLDAPVSRYIPEFGGEGRDEVTVRHLLTHTSALPPGLSLADEWSGYEEGIKRAVAATPVNAPGHIFLYSDVNFILLGEIVRIVAGRPLDRFAAENIYGPLGMVDTGFKPAPSRRIAPTERNGSEMLRGLVHDPTSRRMGGVAGHAGLFSSARDIARFARMMMGEGVVDGIRVLSSNSARMMTSVATPPQVFVRRGLGWDIDSGFSRPRGGFPLGSYGHTGWTGTFLWIDPASSSFYVLLSNRVHPDGGGSVVDLQKQLGRTVSEILIGRSDPADGVRVHPAGSGSALPGIDVLAADRYEVLAGKRTGLITNHTGRDRRGNPTIDLLRSAPGVELVRLFSPEHGIAGVLDETVGDGVDGVRGIPIVSLYGERRAPEPDQLADLDALVFDVQDIGARYYTYISTMGLAMEAAAERGVEFVVLDRPNPIGAAVEGPVAEGDSTFTSFHAIALRHGMTVGELAKLFAAERKLDIKLTVVPVKNWTRETLWDDTGLPWVNPSPNIREPDAALLYPMLGFLETTNLSVGRGTDAPFLQFGAPWLDAEVLAGTLNSRVDRDCLRFEPTSFTPVSSVSAGELVRGVRIDVIDTTRCSMVEAGLVLADELSRISAWDSARLPVLLRHRETVEAIREGRSSEAAPEIWEPELSTFKTRRDSYLLYR